MIRRRCHYGLRAGAAAAADRGDGCRLVAIPAAAATTTAAAAAPATTTTTTLALPRFVHFEGAALELVTIELLNRLLRFGSGCHLHEAEATRLSRGPVGDDGHVFAGTCLREQLLQLLIGDIEPRLPT